MDNSGESQKTRTRLPGEKNNQITQTNLLNEATWSTQAKLSRQVYLRLAEDLFFLGGGCPVHPDEDARSRGMPRLVQEDLEE